MSVRTPRRALVIGHSGDATGATIALLRIMRWCVNHGTLEPTFIFRSDGTVTDEFRKLGRTYVYSQRAEDRLERVSAHLPGGAAAARAGRLARAEWLRLLCRRERADLIYINTAILGGMVPLLEPLGLPF